MYSKEDSRVSVIRYQEAGLEEHLAAETWVREEDRRLRV
jgi:hypothetical protein